MAHKLHESIPDYEDREFHVFHQQVQDAFEEIMRMAGQPVPHRIIEAPSPNRDIAMLEKSGQARIRKYLALTEDAMEEPEAIGPVQLHLSKSKIQGNPKKQKIWKVLAEIDTILERVRDTPESNNMFQIIKVSLMSILRKQKNRIMQELNKENPDHALKRSFNLLYQIRLIVQNIQNGSVTGARRALKKLMEENPNSEGSKNTGSTEKIPTTSTNTSTGPEPTGKVCL